jgi:hypothetical protein
MIKQAILSISFLILGFSPVISQDTIPDGKAFNFPTKKNGISFGNSSEFNGIRINFADHNVRKINGLNVTFWLKMYQNQEAIVNGVSVGVIPTAKNMQPINIGLLGVGASPGNVNGLTIGGFVIGSGGNINGLSVSGLLTMADSDSSAISGVVISGIGVGANHAINGLVLAGLGIGTEGSINGIAASLLWINGGRNCNGIALTAGFMDSDTLRGIAIAGYAKTGFTEGLSLSAYNRTKELHGVQIGLINYAGNNPKGFRILPLLNLHFGK